MIKITLSGRDKKDDHRDSCSQSGGAEERSVKVL